MPFFRYLFLAFLLVPLVEIYFLIQVGEVIGALPTVVLVVFTAVAGVWLLRFQGLATLARVQQSLQRGEVPANAMIEGLLLLLAGAFLLTPGFVTDSLGFLLLLPAFRQMLAAGLLTRGILHTTRRTGGNSSDGGKRAAIEGKFERHDD